MRARDVFLTADGTPRAPWRLVLFVAALAVSFVVVQALVLPLFSWALRLAGYRLDNPFWLLAFTLIGATALGVKWLDKRDWSLVGLHRQAAHPALLGLGLLSGAAGIALPTGLLLLVGWMAVRPQPDGPAVAEAMRQLAALAPAALWEELLFRGYPFAVVRESVGPKVAVAASSLLFGLIHLSNAGASVQSTVLVTLAGVYLGFLFLATGSLYAAWMAHLAWNWTMSAVFHVPVSGAPFPTPDYRVVDAGPDWATGGVWGPEGGYLAALGMAGAYLMVRAGTDLIARRARREETTT